MSATSTIGIKLALDGASQAEASLRRVGTGMEQLSTSAASVRQALGGLGTALAGALSVREFVQAADAVTSLNNSLRLATGSTQAAANAYTKLFDIAQRSRVSFTELGATYASISRAGEALGLSQQRLLGVTEAIGNAMTISGGNAAGMQAALTQLSQGLASGALRGDELNSVMEQSPRLAKALADGLGVTTGKLRELGAEGQITAEKVIAALESQASVLRGEVSSAVLTVGQAFTQLQNASVKAIGDFDKTTGASAALASAISGLATGVQSLGQAFQQNETAIKTTMGVVAGGAAAAGAAALARNIGTVAVAVRALGVALASNPATLALLGIGAAVGGFVAYNEAQKTTEAGIRKTIAALEDLNKAPSIYARDAEGIAAWKKASEERRVQIQKLRADLASMAPSNEGLGSVGSGDTAFARATAAQNARLAETFDEMRTRLSGFRGDFAKYQADLENIQKLQAAGVITEKQAVGMLTELANKHGEVAKAAKSSESEAKKAADAELAWRRRYTLDLIKGWDDEAEARDKAAAAAEAYLARTEQSLIDAAEKGAANVQAKLQALKDEEKALGIAATQNISLAQAIEEVEIARLREQQAALMREGNRDSEVLAMQAEIDARKKLKEAIGGKEARDTARRGAEDAAAEWKKASDQIEQSLTDALMRGFEAGKGFAEVLRDTVANMFKTLVLRPIVSAVVNPVAGAITGSLGLAGTANAATGGSSALGTLGSLASFSSAFGAGGAAGFGALMGGGFTEAVSAGFTTLLTGGSVGTAAAGLGTLAGALGPIALGLGALSSLIGSTKGESRWGGQYGFNFGDGLTDYRRGGEFAGATLGVNRITGAEAFAEAEVQAAISGTVGSINALLKAAGSSAALVGFQAGLETSGKGRGGVFSGGTLSTGATFGESGQGNNYAGTLFEKTSTQSPDAETALKNFALDLQQATIQALQAATDIPDSIAKLVQGVDAESLTAEAAAALLQTVDAQVAGVNQLRAAFDAMGLPQLADIGFDTAAALAQASGGFEALGTNLSGFYATYYTEAERTANAAAQLAGTFGELGVAVPATKEAFRGLVEAALAAGDTQLASGLLQVSGAFASVADAATSAAQQMQSAWASILATRDQGAADAFNVQNLFAQYKATDKYGITDPTAFLTIAQDDFAANYTAEQQKIIAAIVQALNKGVTSAAPTAPTPYGNSYEPAPDTTALQDAIDQITAGLLDARGSLEIELLRAQGKDSEALAALRAQETEGYTAAQLALYDYNQTLRDQIDALQAAKAVADERMGLERQYLQLTGATSVLRALELEALDASNRALQERIWAIQDARQATDSAYAALERAVAKQRETLNTQRTAAQSLVQDISGVFDTLKSNVASMFGQVESTAQFQASQGRSFISDALTAARAGTGLPDGGDLSDAIAAARGGLDAAVYASQAEADFQRLVLANELKDLQDIGGVQLSIAEQQLQAAEDALTALDGTLEAARSQIDALRGVDTSVKTVEEAVRAVEAAIRAEVAAGGAGASGGGLVTSTGDLTASGNAALVANTFRNAFGRDPKAEGLAYWTATGLSGNELVTAIINAGIANGEKIIPGFASGGYHTGGLRVVGENGPELEATGPSRIWNAQQMQQLFSGGSGSSNNERLFNAMLVRLESIEQRMAENNQHARRTADTLTRVAPGDAFVMTPAPVIA